jgi:aryl-alcohol dehydrogenase-like predicted oxidoreductase
MRTINLPNSTLTTSVIALGTTALGTTLNLDDSYRLLDAYLDAGGNFIDTAAVYSDWVPGEKSRVEKVLGGWIAARKNRNRLILSTKGGHPELKSMHISRLSDTDIDYDIRASLQYLRTDVIDLYWLHRDDTSRSVEAIIDTLNRYVKSGALLALGASNWTTERIRAANDYAQRSGQQGFIGNQMLWNVGVPDMNAIPDKTTVAMDAAMWHYHQQSGLAVTPYTAQAGGYFNKVAEGRIDTQSHLAKVYGGATNQRIAQTVQKIAHEQVLTITQVVLGYLLAQPFATVPIVGCKSLHQLEDSLSAAEVRLGAEALQQLQQARGW